MENIGCTIIAKSDIDAQSAIVKNNINDINVGSELSLDKWRKILNSFLKLQDMIDECFEQTPIKAKTQWEYETKEFKILKNENINVDDKLNQFGKDGWECFSISSEYIYGIVARMTNYRPIFGTKYTIKLKRIIQEYQMDDDKTINKDDYKKEIEKLKSLIKKIRIRTINFEELLEVKSLLCKFNIYTESEFDKLLKERGLDIHKLYKFIVDKDNMGKDERLKISSVFGSFSGSTMSIENIYINDFEAFKNKVKNRK